MMRTAVMVVEDDAAMREALCETLELAGYRTVASANGMQAIESLEREEVSVVISDVQMDRMDGHTLLHTIKRRRPELPVLLMTAYGTIQKAVDAMREGAADYLVKPFEAEVLINTVGRFAGQHGGEGHGLLAVDPRSCELESLARRVAATDATVLITGESGVGKEVLAQFIHANSARAEGLFVAINCAAIPENMLEATLFGYDKGAFTGAYKACPGKFEQAQGGTLLLDEISEMDLGLQAKLLRVLQEREVERLGAREMIRLDVRVLATSNRRLRDEVAAGTFREDLFYRLSVFPLHVAALRERPRDIVPLAECFLERGARRQGRPIPTLSEQARARLVLHDWPGNARELDNVMQRALILQTGAIIAPADIRLECGSERSAHEPQTAPEEGAESLESSLKVSEHELILRVLREEMGNRKNAADRLGISPRTLRYKLARMREEGIGVPAGRG